MYTLCEEKVYLTEIIIPVRLCVLLIDIDVNIMWRAKEKFNENRIEQIYNI